MYSSNSPSVLTTAAILSLLSRSFAIPLDITLLNPRDAAYCSYPSTYTITSTSVIYGTPELVTGDFVGPGPTGASISSGYTYIKSMSYTGGIQGTFEITDVFKIAPSGTIGAVIGKGTTLSASVNCPPNVVCGLVARPQLMRVVGFQTMHHCGSNTGFDTAFPCTAPAPSWCPTAVWNITTEAPFHFIADFPIVIPSSTVKGQDQSPTDFLACTVGKGVKGLNPCPLKVGPAPATK